MGSIYRPPARATENLVQHDPRDWNFPLKTIYPLFVVLGTGVKMKLNCQVAGQLLLVLRPFIGSFTGNQRTSILPLYCLVSPYKIQWQQRHGRRTCTAGLPPDQKHFIPNW